MSAKRNALLNALYVRGRCAPKSKISCVVYLRRFRASSCQIFSVLWPRAMHRTKYRPFSTQATPCTAAKHIAPGCPHLEVHACRRRRAHARFPRFWRPNRAEPVGQRVSGVSSRSTRTADLSMTWVQDRAPLPHGILGKLPFDFHFSDRAGNRRFRHQASRCTPPRDAPNEDEGTYGLAEQAMPNPNSEQPHPQPPTIFISWFSSRHTQRPSGPPPKSCGPQTTLCAHEDTGLNRPRKDNYLSSVLGRSSQFSCPVTAQFPLAAAQPLRKAPATPGASSGQSPRGRFWAPNGTNVVPPSPRTIPTNTHPPGRTPTTGKVASAKPHGRWIHR